MARIIAPLYPAPICRFYVYPERRRGLRVAVEIHRSEGGLRKADRLGGGSGRRNLGGLCVYQNNDPRTVATVHLMVTKLWDITVVHEFGHAAIEWARQKGLNRHKIWMNQAPDVERYVEGHASMVRQFWTEFHRRHLHGESWFVTRQRYV